MNDQNPIADAPIERRACWIQGIVQGVGFRPFVYNIAVQSGLTGFVRNQSGLVYLEVEGTSTAVEQFALRVVELAPPLSRIESVRWESLPVQGTIGFHILESTLSESHQVFVSPDIATCGDCLAELFNPSDRRYLYPFINCMNCGPRLTIIREAPYDRQRTTMSGFAMCAECRREYEDPEDRRFHAQPIACPACGPQLQLLTNTGETIKTQDPLSEFAQAIRSGKLGLLKGLGGYHLVCDAGAQDVVANLRNRKHRDAKPFAVMVSDLNQARRICEIDALESGLLCSSRRPIVLLRRCNDEPNAVAEAVAPGNPYLGVMLPYTPLHELLMRQFEGRPLVMTSGNHSDEPMAHVDLDAVNRLGPIVDVILTHNRSIHVRCDDSVTRSIGGHQALIRRSRGYAPQPLPLPMTLRQPTLAVGGQLKATFGLGRDRQAFLSHHLGDLDHLSAYQAFERDLQLYEDLFGARPELIVHDLHPDYASTSYAVRRAAAEGLRLLAVQHHHAHVASGMAEHGLTGSVIGVAFDGTGYGTDAAIWGGEFLIAEYADFYRAAHLRYVGLPGGDAAIREPWRAAVAHLVDAGCDPSRLLASIPPTAIRTARQMLERGFNSPRSSSMGRLFDAVAAIAGLRTHASYEGQAAIELEFQAMNTEAQTPYPFEIASSSGEDNQPRFEVDTRPMIRGVAEDAISGCAIPLIARRFHSTAVEIVSSVCSRLRERWKLERVVLSGGVFMNGLLSNQVMQRLRAEGFLTYQQQVVPCNDGGLSFGQLAVAAARDSVGE